MKRYGLILLVVLIASAGLLAAAAYNTATVVSAANLKIVATNQALLQLRHPAGQAGTRGNKDATFKIVDGEMFVQFGMGVAANGTTEQMYGLQPNSSYAWEPLFTIANMSAETLDITVTASSELLQYMTFGDMGQVGGGVYSVKWGTKGQPLTFANVTKNINSGLNNVRSVAVKIELPAFAQFNPADLRGTITVSAVAK